MVAPRLDRADFLMILRGSGEPGRNRTFNQQIKSPNLTRPRRSVACFALGICPSARPLRSEFSTHVRRRGRQHGRQSLKSEYV